MKMTAFQSPLSPSRELLSLQVVWGSLTQLYEPHLKLCNSDCNLNPQS